jgi:hypothetical protein
LVSPKTAIFYMSFFFTFITYLLLGYFGRHWFRLGFAEQLQAGNAKCCALGAAKCITSHSRRYILRLLLHQRQKAQKPFSKQRLSTSRGLLSVTAHGGKALRTHNHAQPAR